MSETTKTLDVVVCRGPSCSVMDSADLLDWCRDLQAAQLPINCSESGCTGNCLEAPVVQWNGRYLTEVTPEKLTEQLMEEDLF